VSREEVVAFSAERITERIGFLRRAAEGEGRDPSSIEVAGFSGVVQLAESEAEAAATLEGMAKMFDVSAEEVRDHPMTLVGTPAQIAESLERRRESWGIDAQMISVQSVEAAEVFGKEIIPRLA
jgi:alkanesulfonate monooxygenase SsuD/methylene tetrahydromethanopterin reductase-like flavin-dependent oxidoreductase (luciferase family)